MKRFVIATALFVSAFTMVFADESEQRRLLLNTAQKYLKVPYVYAGNTPKGFDCSGFVNYVYKNAIDMDIPRSSSAIWGSTAKSIPVTDAQPGDVLVFANNGKIDHVSLKVDNAQMIHAVSDGSPTGVLIGSIMSNYFGPRLYGAKRFLPDAVPAPAPSTQQPAPVTTTPPAASQPTAKPATTTPATPQPAPVTPVPAAPSQPAPKPAVTTPVTPVPATPSQPAVKPAATTPVTPVPATPSQPAVKPAVTTPVTPVPATPSQPAVKPATPLPVPATTVPATPVQPVTLPAPAPVQQPPSASQQPAPVPAQTVPAAVGPIKPPSWLVGSWSYVTPNKVTIISEFTANDIIVAGSSYSQMIVNGEIAKFTQTSTNLTYVIKIVYSDGTQSSEEFAQPKGTKLSSFYSDTKGTKGKLCAYQKVTNVKKPADMSKISIKPPSWIQGVWKITDGQSMYAFTGNDMLIDGYSVIESLKLGEIAHFEQIDGGSSYTITLTYPNGDWTTERFVKQLSKDSISSFYSDMRSFRRSEVTFKYKKL